VTDKKKCSTDGCTRTLPAASKYLKMCARCRDRADRGAPLVGRASTLQSARKHTTAKEDR
jgi:hypothetical protein